MFERIIFYFFTAIYIPNLNFAPFLVPNIDPRVTDFTPLIQFASILGPRIMSLPESSPRGGGRGHGLYNNNFEYSHIKMLSCKMNTGSLSIIQWFLVIVHPPYCLFLFIISALTKSSF